MINNDTYSLCIDINNKLFLGKLHFASCREWSIKVICKDFTWIYISSRKSDYSSSSEDDLTVNREAKQFMKDQFTSWYSAQIQSQLDSGVVLDDVDVDLRLSVLKPIHATWIVSMYNHLSSSEGRQSWSIAKGWKKAGVTDVVSGSKKIPPEDLFEDLDV